MYKTFKVGELFDIHPTSAYKMKNDELFASDGTTPVLSNSSVNNGIGGYCGLAPTEQGGMITFSDTTTGADTMFYQSNPFIGYPHVQGMYPYQPDKWDEKCCLYVISCIRKSAGNGWSYAVKFNRALVKELSIELPVVESADVDHEYTVDDINYGYMQERIAELEQERIAELDAYLVASGLDDYELTDEDKEILSLSPESASDEAGASEADFGNGQVRFKKFALDTLFTSSTGDVDLQQKDINGKGEFFINSGVENRGIKGRTDRPARIFPANTITVDFWGNAYYRDFEYKMATHNHVFSLAGDVIRNRLVGMYIVGILSKLPKLFSYNNMATWNKLKTIEVSLPVTLSGDIDFDYMERYIRAIEKLAIADVAKYKDKLIATTRQVVGA
ncbi:restriction endonuclease subunit S [Longicatena caecimuris]|uniref:restriction endonuclease subunit S n=1 Tax=Longicatena caecimuris TaxID=1796635 RepID=UPI0022E2BAC6|nr:restriction endonuclease subunit S [Longicatena caecimuris]